MQRQIKLLLVIALVVLSAHGLMLRFVKIDDKEFWHDEAFTALVLSGRTVSELKASIAETPTKLGDLAKFRSVDQRSTLPAILNVIAHDEPGHAPLFYLLELFACTVFGTTINSMRLVCAVISVITLPVIFWLSLELYKSRLLALFTTTIASLSPLLIYYAQEARDYSLGIFFMTLSSAILLYAIRSTKKIAWILYALSLVFGLYSWLFIGVTMLAHAAYILITQIKTKAVLVPAGAAMAAALLAIVPWLLFLLPHGADVKRAYDWMVPSLTSGELLTVWLAIPYKAFALFGFKTARFGTLLFAVTALEVTALVLSAIPERNPKYLLLFVILVWSIVFAGPDLVSGGARSAVFRYQIPVIVSFLLLFTSLPEALFKRGALFKTFAVLVSMLIVGTELLSDHFMVNCKIWPDKAINLRFTLPIARRLSAERNAYIVVNEGDINPTELLDLSYAAPAETRLIYLTGQKPQSLPSDANVLYLWNATREFQTQLEQHFALEPNVDNFPYLTRAVRK